MLRSLTLTALLLAAATAHAADDKGRFAVKGPGLETCEIYNKEYADKSQKFYVMGGWLLGFLTGQNLHLEETYDVTTWQSSELLLALIDSYCKNRPEQRFAEATIALIRVLMPHRLTEESKLTLARSGERGLRLYEQVLRRTQEKLKQDGHYGGVVDGLFGPGTAKAIAAYQKANNLPETGLPDQRTLFTMFQGDLRGSGAGITPPGDDTAPTQD